MRMREHGELLEWAEVHGNFYGTPRAPVEKALAAGRDVLFDIDWQGTEQLSRIEELKPDLVRVFVLPPNFRELRARLERRAEDAPEVIRRRLANARLEIGKWSRVRLRHRQRGSRPVLSGGARDPRGRAPAPRARHRPCRLRRRPAEGSRRSRSALSGSAQTARNARAEVRERPRPGAPRRGASARSRLLRRRASGSAQSCLRLERSILRRWPKAAAVTASTRRHRDGARHRRAARGGPPRR